MLWLLPAPTVSPRTVPSFLSYGLVEVPRDLLNKANTEGQLRYVKFRVAVQSEALQNARRKLEETLELVHSTDTQLRAVNSSPELSENMAEILRRCSTYELAATTRTQQLFAARATTPRRPSSARALLRARY